ncbi:hypothetical protein ID854_06825 [Xenorhabdus sp. M]|uniref:YopX protein domain-containing protein n=2 Tax=Xenorhabdus szentirmaii TaxID=290112 RepID=A0AAW3YQ79_9GAMM|nr:hypothetical protein [Xenorhabdus sp. M]MBD2800182.1 hypothetical protein [Xenorhabdus sp. M]
MNKELQVRWMNNQLIGLDVIINDTDMVKYIDIFCTQNNKLKNAFEKEYCLSYEGKSTLSGLLERYNDPWSEIQINDQLLLSDNSVVICGEGEMGNEGFIVRIDKNKNIKWCLYSTQSNPFMEITQKNNRIYVQSTSKFYVVLNPFDDEISIIQ